MNDFSINEMQEMQKALQEKYKGRWEPICPETGKNNCFGWYANSEKLLTW